MKLSKIQKHILSRLDTCMATQYVHSFNGKKIPNYLDRQQINFRKMRSPTIDELKIKEEKYLKGRWYLSKQRVLYQRLFDDKKPGEENLGEWVSVEIECLFPNRDRLTDFGTQTRKDGLGKYVTIKDDGSIHTECDGDCHGDNCYDDNGDRSCDDCHCDNEQIGKEIVVTFKIGEPYVLQQICKNLDLSDASVNKSCGLHVHFDMRHVKKMSVIKFANRIANCVPALKQMLPKSRRDNSYCRETINDFDNGDRYAFVNVQSYTKHKTLEIRGHSGTISYKKIINWIRLLNVIMSTKTKMYGVGTIPELLSVYKLDGDLFEYVVNRYAKFTVDKINVLAEDSEAA